MRNDPGAISNGDIAELLAVEAESAHGNLQRAFRRAARNAFLWPKEAVDILGAGESLTSLAGVGPYLEKRIRTWIEHPVCVRPPPIRRDFLTLACARAVLSRAPE